MKIGTESSEQPGGGRYTISRPIDGEAKYIDSDLEKYAHIRVVVSPCEEEGNQFQWRPPEGDLPLAFMAEACREGATAALDPLPGGGRLVRVCVSVIGGSYHEQDTDEGAVRIATMRAVRDALTRATLVPI